MIKTIPIHIWEGCYDKGLKSFIVPDAFAHPAKYSLGLIERIFNYCLERGYLHKGDVVGDPFGGVAIGGLVAAYRGLRWIGVELEPKFFALCRANIQLHRSKLEYLGFPLPVIIQGDSRKFHEHVQASGIVTSPPYADSVNSDNNGIDWSKTNRPDRLPGAHNKRNNDTMVTGEYNYGQTPGQIGRLKAGEVAGVISSPPYGTREDGGGIAVSGDTSESKGGKQLGRSCQAVISSPPYAVIAAGAGGLNTKPAKHAGQQSGRQASAASQDTDQRYGKTEGQIAALKGGSVEAVVSSPPFETSSHVNNTMMGQKAGKGTHSEIAAVRAKKDYIEPDSPGQIGKEKGESYWEAMNLVYRSCFLAIKPGGYIVMVVKDYVKGGKRVPLCDDTCRLLEHIGFTMVERIHAMLVKETRHEDLFLGPNGFTTTSKSRKSFFRRLAEKNGSPKIDFEEVLIARKPL